ncbi:hypothetical protein K402DRAFT_324430 [Aulographum hederae CBS 113979]|uniref:Guanine nucleotide exchange factor Vps9 n=1 Tax=Aulographum hederae CBS 113979 TaxID=1176131 RepID=A0A6G1HCF8_9PEZI|nr:hypothetical protein K402DRAFT_324430 [Aulographum hederae CBS 113979]
MESPAPPPPPPKDEKFLHSSLNASSDPPTGAHGKQRETPVNGVSKIDTSSSGGKPIEKSATGEDHGDTDSQSEIQSIMEQFDEGGPGEDEIMSPRLEFAGPVLSSPVLHPPRKSSLEPLSASQISLGGNSKESASPQNSQTLQSPPPRTSSLYSSGSPNHSRNDLPDPSPSSSRQPPSIQKAPPPAPDPEPDLPFDFHRFLEQLRHRTADPVAKFLRSFLVEFGKKQWAVHEQVKIISDFLEFISKKMAQCEVWRTVSDAEFDNAREGMEKLVMNRLYTQTFSPAIPPPDLTPEAKGRRKVRELPLGPGRRGQHQEDVERDEVLAQKVSIYGWVKEEHLDIPPVGDKGRKFLRLAQQELLKIKNYRAPRDKVICVLNCCKVIFGFLRNSASDQSADSFVPLLIYVVLQANPENLVSNVQYILRFRNQDKLGGEAGYYISSLMGAVQFIENLDRTSLTISDEEFEKNVEAAVSAIAERHSAEEERKQAPQGHTRNPSPSHNMQISEKSTISRPEVTPRNSLEAEQVTPRRTTSQKKSNQSEGTEDNTDNDAVAGLLRTIQKPLSTIGRIFSDDNSTPNNASSSEKPSSQQAASGAAATSSRLSPAAPILQRHGSSSKNTTADRRSNEHVRQQMSAEDAAARQASAEAEEARRIQRQEHKVVVETLQGMFPGLDKEVIDDVVRQKQGRVGLAVDACLALSS